MGFLTYELSAFADEISADLTEQLDVLERNAIGHIEFRGVWNKNVLDLSDDEVSHVITELRRRKIQVSAIGSPIGKIGIEDDFDQHLARFRRAIDIAHRLETRHIRIFSFYLPQDNNAARYRDEVIRRMTALCDEAERADADITLLHENEKEIYGDTAERCQDLVRTLDRANFGVTFDPANFVQVHVRPFTEAYPLLADAIRYVHIKDARWADGSVVPAGQGDGQLADILQALAERGFSGYLSIEPHLAVAGRSSGYSGATLFGQAVEALRGLLVDERRFRPLERPA